MITRSPAPTVIADNVQLPPKVPALPADVIARFPSLANWETDTTRWYKKLSGAIQDANRTISQTNTAQTTATRNLVISANGISASIVEERDARIAADSALAFDILTLTASVDSDVATLNAAISTEQTVRANADTAIALSVTNLTSTVSTNLTNTNAAIASEASTRATADTAIALSVTNLTSTVNTNNSTVTAAIAAEASTRATDDTAIALSVTNLTATVNTNNATLTAAVSAEASARATADGFLSSNYSITVTAGSVVTGMQLNSSTGGGASSSTIDFQGTNFRIWDGTTAFPIFYTSTGLVKLANTLTVNTSGKVFIGTGTYGNTNTAFYVDSAGQFSLKDKLTWDGTTLTITGGGTFSGALSAASGTFAGSLSAATGTFAGSLSAATGSFSGSVTATSGTIGGWTLAATSLTAGSGATTVGLDSGGTNPAFYAGSATPGSAPFRVTNAGALTATNATISGSITSTSGTIGGFTINSSNLYGGSGDSFINLNSSGGTITLGETSAMQMSLNSGGITFLYTSASVVSLTIANMDINVPLVLGGNVGFYGHAATAKQTITGSRSGNAALASLLSGLSAIGLITDSSS